MKRFSAKEMGSEHDPPETVLIITKRLELVPATPELIYAALEGPEALGAHLGASVPPTGPPQYLDPPALQYTLFALPAVQRVIAETLPELTPSIGLLRKRGFRLIGAGSEPGVIRFELTRAEYVTARGAA